MQTRDVPAADLHGPEDKGASIQKGSLVIDESRQWRVLSTEPLHEHRLSLVLQEVGGANSTKRIEVSADRVFTLVVEAA